MYILPSVIGENNILKLSLIWILRKFYFFFLNSNFNCAILFKTAKHNVLHCQSNVTS